jgi:hypothetical protein
MKVGVADQMIEGDQCQQPVWLTSAIAQHRGGLFQRWGEVSR